MTEAELAALNYHWEFWARPDQLPPAEFAALEKTYWTILAGRGWGKTRVGAEQVRKWVRTCKYVNIIGATIDDARDIMIEGESGILAVCPAHERPLYVASKRRLEWPNGARTLIFTADEPERLRGKQHEKLWADELGAWRYSESWDQAQFGLRLGAHPQALVTTTPRPTPIVKSLISDPDCVVTRGTTYHNRENLASAFYRSIIRKYEGTRLGRQELNAEVLDDNPFALWRRAEIDAQRVSVTPDLTRIVVGVDPAVTSEEDSDETGIIVAGVGDAPLGWAGKAEGEHYYVVADASLRDTPMKWAAAAIEAYHDHAADRVIGETNNGGDMIEALLRAVDENVSYEKVTATRGKMIRAEPIAALYEQGRVHHVGAFAELEDQMCDYDPLTSDKSPDRMDALVWALSKLSDNADSSFLHFMRQQAEAANAARAGAH